MMKRLFLAAPLAFGLTTPAQSIEQFIEPVVIISSYLCLGFDCLNPDSAIPNRQGLKVKDDNPAILFDDTSTLTNHSITDWQINANEFGAGGREAFFISDVTNVTNPFWLEAAAPSNSLYVNDMGRIGVGTSMPETELHILGPGSVATIRLEETSGFPGRWDIIANNGSLRIQDKVNGTQPFSVGSSAPDWSFDIDNNGNIGLGTFTPEGKLHTKGEGVQLAYFESSDGNAVQVRFRTDSENRRFLAVNNANEVKSQIVFGDDQIQFLGQTVANEWLSISEKGIVSAGPECNPNPCDRTFDPEYFEVPPIEERAAYMWENMHLPAVGPTAPGEPFNLTEKTAGMLHELEIAHIYIAQQAEQNTAQSSLIAQQAQVIAELSARVDALEAQ